MSDSSPKQPMMAGPIPVLPTMATPQSRSQHNLHGPFTEDEILRMQNEEVLEDGTPPKRFSEASIAYSEQQTRQTYSRQAGLTNFEADDFPGPQSPNMVNVPRGWAATQSTSPVLPKPAGPPGPSSPNKRGASAAALPIGAPAYPKAKAARGGAKSPHPEAHPIAGLVINPIIPPEAEAAQAEPEEEDEAVDDAPDGTSSGPGTPTEENSDQLVNS
jgi:hypothetical protein